MIHHAPSEIIRRRVPHSVAWHVAFCVEAVSGLRRLYNTMSGSIYIAETWWTPPKSSTCVGELRDLACSVYYHHHYHYYCYQQVLCSLTLLNVYNVMENFCKWTRSTSCISFAVCYIHSLQLNVKICIPRVISKLITYISWRLWQILVKFPTHLVLLRLLSCVTLFPLVRFRVFFCFIMKFIRMCWVLLQILMELDTMYMALVFGYFRVKVSN